MFSDIVASEDGRTVRFYVERTKHWREVEEWLEKGYPEKHWNWRFFWEEGSPTFTVLLVKKRCVECYNANECIDCGVISCELNEKDQCPECEKERDNDCYE